MDVTTFLYPLLVLLNFGVGIYVLTDNSAAAINIGFGVGTFLLAILIRMPVV